jgi:hypothetical protein
MSDSLPSFPPSALPAGQAEELLSQSDTGIVRVLEDLINELINRGVIKFTDLPVPAQNKLLSRQQTRSQLKNALGLLPADDEGGLL